MPPPVTTQPNTRVTVTTTMKRQDSISSSQSETQSEYRSVTTVSLTDITIASKNESDDLFSAPEVWNQTWQYFLQWGYWHAHWGLHWRLHGRRKWIQRRRRLQFGRRERSWESGRDVLKKCVRSVASQRAWVTSSWISDLNSHTSNLYAHKTRMWRSCLFSLMSCLTRLWTTRWRRRRNQNRQFPWRLQETWVPDRLDQCPTTAQRHLRYKFIVTTFYALFFCAQSRTRWQKWTDMWPPRPKLYCFLPVDVELQMNVRRNATIRNSLQESRSGSDSSTGAYNHLLRHSGETAAERDERRNKRGVTFAEGTTPTTTEASESEEERPQVYSIDLYRSSWFVFWRNARLTNLLNALLALLVNCSLEFRAPTLLTLHMIGVWTDFGKVAVGR